MTQFGDYLEEKLTAAIAAAIEKEKDTLTSIAGAAKSSFSTGGGGGYGDVGGIASLIAAVFIGFATADGVAEAVAVLEAIGSGGGSEGTAFGMGWVMGSILFNLAEPVIRPAQHGIEDAIHTQIFDPQQAADLASRGVISPDFARSEGGGGGFDSGHMDSMIEGAYTYPDLSSLFTLLNLQNGGASTGLDFATAFKRHGIPEPWLDQMAELARNRLSVADLALAALRNNLDPTIAKEYALTLGVTNEDFQTLVDNTGEPPGVMQQIEMWRRGIIPKDGTGPDVVSLQQGIAESRMKVKWTDAIEGLRFEPMTTADAVRAVVQNQLAQSGDNNGFDGETIAGQNGMDAASFDVLVKTEGRPPSHEQMMKAHRLGVAGPEGSPVSLSDVAQAVRESDIKDKYVSTVIGIEREVVPQRTIVMMLEHGVITAQRAEQMLAEAGYIAEDAANIIALGHASRTGTAKHLTRTDIILLYENAAMNAAEAVNALTTLGYTHDDAVSALQVADIKVHASLNKTMINQIHASWKAHRLDDVAAMSALATLGMDHAQAESLLIEWQTVKGTPFKTLTEAQIVKAAEYSIISTAEAQERLVSQLGYSDADATILLQVAGVLPTTGIIKG